MLKLILLIALAVSSAAAASAAGQQQDQNFCQGCRSIISYASRFNSTDLRQDNKQLFQNFCELYLPPSTDNQEGPCPTFVALTFSIFDRVDPVSHCDRIGACSPSGVQPAPSNQVALDAQAGSGIFCQSCQQAVSQMQGQIEDPKFIEQIHHYVSAFCEYLSAVNEDKECRQFLDKYVDQAIDFVRHIDPLKYCESIALCPKEEPSAGKRLQLPTLADFNDFGIETSVELDSKRVEDIDGPLATGVEKGPTCALCRTVVKEMFKFLKNNRTEANIRDSLEKICSIVYRQGHNRDQCDDMVDKYTKSLIELLADETDPEVICMILEQCFYSRVQAVQPPTDMMQFISILDPTIKLGSMKTCVECKLFVTYLKDTVKDAKSEDEIKQWLLTELCGNIQDKRAQNSCNQMVNTYASVFFKALSDQLDPKTTCIELHACHGRLRSMLKIDNAISEQQQQLGVVQDDRQEIDYLSQLMNPRAPEAPRTCDQCIEVVTQLDKYLSAHSVDHDVAVLVDQVCNQIPNDPLRKKCTYIVTFYGQEIIQAISTMDNPRQLCSKIMLC